MIGKSFSCSAFCFIYIHTSETLPTEVRNLGMSTASTFGRAASLVGPYLSALVSSNYGMMIQSFITLYVGSWK